jgi:hypothetical protein
LCCGDSFGYGSSGAQANDALNVARCMKNTDDLQAKTYFCNGQWKTAGPGANAAVEINMGGDDSTFQNMLQLNHARQYSELLKVCSAQIQSAPEWLTPRLFCGLAYLGTGDKINAKAMLAEFDSRTGPAYGADACKQMSDFLHAQLR